MTGKERAALRAAANTLEPIFWVGKEGVTDAVIAQVEDTFNTRELFKLKIHLESAPVSPKEIAVAISEATHCEIIQVVGGTVVLFRINLKLRQSEAEKKKRAKELKDRQARERRAERARMKYSSTRGNTGRFGK